MRTETITVYRFEELSDAAKENARNWYRSGGLDYEWWESTYEDAERIGLKITSFDLDRNRHATGEFTEDALHTANKIMEEHGPDCETYKTSEAFLAERDTIVEQAERDEDGEFVDEHELDGLLDDCEAEYLQSILEDYSIMLQHEFEYLYSDESVDENIQANEYEFTEDGQHYA